MESLNLIDYQLNINSQCGEDGIIEEICRRLNIKTGYFVEFGAWDGKHHSNTFNLLFKNWRGVYIEADEIKYKDLLMTKNEFPKQLTTICAFVRSSGDNKLDNLLSQTSTPKDFELLSIDIDSEDYLVWYSLQNYNPKIVIIEGNSLVLPGIWQIHQDGVSQGNSFSAIIV